MVVMFLDVLSDSGPAIERLGIPLHLFRNGKVAVLYWDDVYSRYARMNVTPGRILRQLPKREILLREVGSVRSR